ncbi:MAG: peptidase BlaR1 [Ferruginibacter sp.]|nr:peptidase BlaR1 [Ferruginibacter sp.]
MEQFSYSFALTMLHSLWQSGLLLLCFMGVTRIFTNLHPHAKRNLLYALLGCQLVVSVLTFSFYYAQSAVYFREILALMLNSMAVNSDWLQAYAPWLFYGYSSIVTFKLCQLLFNWLQFRKNFQRHLIKPAVDYKLFTQVKAFEFGIKRKVQLWYSEAVSTPITFGFFKPVILLPLALVSGLQTREIESLLIHELTHIRNNDYLLNWILLITETIFFFNPFIRIAASHIRLEREKSCDAQVLQFEYPGLLYAETLLKTARQSRRHRSFQLAAVLTRPMLLQRIRFFSEEDNLRFRKRNFALVPALLLLTVMTVNLLVLGRFSKEKTTTATATTTSIVTRQTERPAAFTTKAPVGSFAAVAINPTTKPLLPKQEDAPFVAETTEPDEPAIDVENRIIPVGYQQPQPVVVKEVIMNEENSLGQKITRAYKVQLKNGKWIAEPLYVITETKAVKDSLHPIADTLISLLPAIQ